MKRFSSTVLALLHFQCLFSRANTRCGLFSDEAVELCEQIKPAMYQIQGVTVIPGWDGKSPLMDRALATNYIDDTTSNIQYRAKREIVDAHTNIGLFTRSDEPLTNPVIHAAVLAPVSGDQQGILANKFRSSVGVEYNIKPHKKRISPIPKQIRPINRRGRKHLRTLSRRIPGRVYTLRRRGIREGAFVEIDPNELGYLIEAQDRPLSRQNFTSSPKELLEKSLQARAISGNTAQKPGSTASGKFESHPKQSIPPNAVNEPNRSVQIVPDSSSVIHTAINSVNLGPVEQIVANNEDDASSQEPSRQYTHQYYFSNERPVQNAVIYKGDEETSRTTGAPIYPDISNIRSIPTLSESVLNITGLSLSSGFYAYPPKLLPAPSCFYNPTGYVCCNIDLNNLMQETYAKLAADSNFDRCNIALVARSVQKAAEQRFARKFESLVGLDDFAQKISFSDDLVCKIEVDGKYILAYATKENDAIRAT